MPRPHPQEGRRVWHYSSRLLILLTREFNQIAGLCSDMWLALTTNISVHVQVAKITSDCTIPPKSHITVESARPRNSSNSVRPSSPLGGGSGCETNTFQARDLGQWHSYFQLHSNFPCCVDFTEYWKSQLKSWKFLTHCYVQKWKRKRKFVCAEAVTFSTSVKVHTLQKIWTQLKSAVG